MPAVALRRPLYRALPALALLLCCAGAPAHADELDRVRQLQAAGQLEQALHEVRQLIGRRPNDPQYRVTEALILQQMHRDPQAIDVLHSLTVQYPELPEPHNNLAVLYAAQGDDLLALEQLHMALRTNPAYATAASNLGDVYLQLAADAYRKAVAGSGDAAAQAHARARLRLLQSLQHAPTPAAAGDAAAKPAP